MKTKQWDNDIEKSIKHRTPSEILEDYFEQQRKEKENNEFIEEFNKQNNRGEL